MEENNEYDKFLETYQGAYADNLLDFEEPDNRCGDIAEIDENTVLQQGIQKICNFFDMLSNTNNINDIESFQYSLFEASISCERYIIAIATHNYEIRRFYSYVSSPISLPEKYHDLASLYDETRKEGIEAITKIDAYLKEIPELSRIALDSFPLFKPSTEEDLSAMKLQLAIAKSNVLVQLSNALEEVSSSLDRIEKQENEKKSKNTHIEEGLFKTYGSTMTAEEVAKYFNISIRSIYNWEKKGDLININTTSNDMKSNGGKKRGSNRLFLTKDVSKLVSRNQERKYL